MDTHYKVTLSTGKELVMRSMKIRDYNTAAAVAGKKATDNQALLGMLLQNEIIKILLVKCNGKDLSGAEREDLDGLLTLTEYTEVSSFVEELLGKKSKPKVEVVQG